MDICDCFCGIGPWATRDPILPCSADDIVRQLDRFGIARALAYSNIIKFAAGAADGNAALLTHTRGNGRLIPAFSISPHPYDRSPDLDECFAVMRDAGARGLWLNIPFSPYRLVRSHARWMIGAWLDRCVKARLPVLLHIEDQSPDIVDTLCREHPHLRLILTGVTYTGDGFLYPLLRAHPNLRVALGHMYIPSGNPQRFLSHFADDRLLFGSGLPEFSPGGLIAHITYADIPDAAKAAILGGSLQTLMSEVKL